jgi:hypothetical protein
MNVPEAVMKTLKFALNKTGIQLMSLNRPVASHNARSKYSAQVPLTEPILICASERGSLPVLLESLTKGQNPDSGHCPVLR